MPRNGSGSFSLAQPAFQPNTTILSAAVNSDLSDIASALTASICSDGQTPITGQLKFPSGSNTAPSFTFNIDLTTGMYYGGTGVLSFAAGGVNVVNFNESNVGTGHNGALITYGNGAIPCPVGSVMDFAGSTAPAGWYLCYGQSMSATSYPELFTVIGYTYGGSSGTFSLPDLRGRATFGQDNMGGTAANRITVAGGNFDGTVLGGSGGQQSTTTTITLSSTNQLPQFTVTGTISTITPQGTIGGSQTVGPWSESGSGPSSFSAGPTGLNTYSATVSGSNFTFTGQSVTPAFTGGSIGSASPSAVTSASFSTLSPAFILNKIIFVGRP